MGRKLALHGCDVALNMNAWRASCGIMCGVWTWIGFSVVMDDMGIMTLSSSSSRTGSVIIVGISTKDGSSIDGAGGAAGGTGAAKGVGASVGARSTVGLSRGDRRQVGSGIFARPGVLLRVVRLWVRGVVLTTLGAVGLLDNVGSTLGGVSTVSSTLGDCLLVRS